MKIRLYFDNCSFNRPYDDLSLLKNYLEAEAKTYIQREIIQKKYELVWSYILDYEVSFNPFFDKKEQIIKWKNIAIADIGESKAIIAMANEIMKKNIKPKDSLHLACAIEVGCNYFVTTDEKILNKLVENIVITDPIDFVKMTEVYK